MKQEVSKNIDLDRAWEYYSNNNAAKLFDLQAKKFDVEKEGLCPICGEVMQKKRGSVEFSDKTNKKFNWTVYPLDGNDENVEVENLQPMHAACAAKIAEAPKTLATWQNVQAKLGTVKKAPVATKKPATKKTDTTPATKKAPVTKAPAKKVETKKVEPKKPVAKKVAK